MRDALLRDINLEMRLRPDRTDNGNQTSRVRRSYYDKDECEKEIAHFLDGHQERDDIAE